MTNLSTIRSVVVPLSIFVTGLLAGVMLGVAMEQQTAQKLPEAAWTLRQQNDDALFRRVMPFTFIAMMLLLIASTFPFSISDKLLKRLEAHLESVRFKLRLYQVGSLNGQTSLADGFQQDTRRVNYFDCFCCNFSAESLVFCLVCCDCPMPMSCNRKTSALAFAE